MIPLWRLTTARRNLFEKFGSYRYSHPAYNGIEDSLLRRLSSPGFFVEAGAVDGFFESNTYFLEKYHGWRGVLIEPVPEMYERLKVNRPHAKRFNCALVANETETPKVSVSVNHAMSKVSGIGSENIDDKISEVRGRTLTNVLREVKAKQIDLLSLDVEGFEFEVLKGLDFSLYKPRYILCECLDEKIKGSIITYLIDEYEMVEKLTYRDYLFEAK